MESVIEQLFYGRINPAQAPRPTDAHTRKLEKAYSQAYEAFRAKIDPELHRELGRVLDDCVALDAREGAAYFVEGFRLGARMMLDVLGCSGFRG